MLTRKSFAIALTGAVLCAPALGADMGYAPPDYSLTPEQPVTLGNGWYLRGDASWARENAPAITGDPLLASVLAGPVGKNDGWAATIGAGYQFNNYFRADLTVDYRNVLHGDARSPNFECVTDVVGVTGGGGAPLGINAETGDCHSRQRATFKRSSLLANAYIDLGTWTGVTPYVGAGVGVTFSRAQGEYDWLHDNGAIYAPYIAQPVGFPATWVTVAGDPAAAPEGFAFGAQGRGISRRKAQTNLTWALMAGVAVDVSRNAKIDFGYRFVSMGALLPGVAKKDGQIQEVRIGLRYSPD